MHSSDFEKAALYFEKYFELAPIEPLIFPGQYVSLNIGMKRVDKAEEILDRGAKKQSGGGVDQEISSDSGRD